MEADKASSQHCGEESTGGAGFTEIYKAKEVVDKLKAGLLFYKS